MVVPVSQASVAPPSHSGVCASSSRCSTHLRFQGVPHRSDRGLLVARLIENGVGGDHYWLSEASPRTLNGISIVRRLLSQKMPHRIHLSRVVGDVKHRVLQEFSVGKAGLAPRNLGVRVGIQGLEM